MSESMGTCGRIAGRLAVVASIMIGAVLAFGGQEGVIGTSTGAWELGLTGGAAFPVGAFRNNLGTNGWSIDIFMGKRLGRSPFRFGFDLYVMNYGDRTHDEFLSGTIPLEVRVETENNVIQGLFYLKCQPSTGRVRPYVEALAGGSYLYTKTWVTGVEYPYDDIASSTNFDDFTVSAGGGAGFDVWLGGRRGSRGTQAGCRLDFKVRYLLGGHARYLREDSIVYEGDTFTYLYRESATSLLSVQAGVLFNF